jgi:Tol biopolymer transport system component
MPVGVLVIIPIIIIGFGVYAFTGQRTVPPADGTATASGAGDATGTALAVATPPPTATSIPAAPPFSPPLSPPWAPWPGEATPSAPYPPTETSYQPITSHGAFNDGDAVRVSTGDGDCLNARSIGSVESEYVTVNECVPDGYEGVIVGPASENEGHWWWRLAGSGYVAEEYLTDLGPADLRGPWARGVATPAGATGSIAFVQGAEIRVLDTDSGSMISIATLPRVRPNAGADYEYISYPSDMQWSPDGTMLSYNLAPGVDTDGSGAPVDLHIVRPDGAEVRVVPGVAGRGWSPDGARIGIVIGARQQAMGIGWTGVPALVDVATGDITRLDAEEVYQQDPPSFNYDGSLVMISRNDLTTADDGSVSGSQSFVVIDLAGNVVARVSAPPKHYYYNALWSPAANAFSFYESRGGEGGDAAESYSVYDVGARAIVARSAMPSPDQQGGGGCGSRDMYRASWSADGRTLYYATMYRAAGANGVWAWDLASGAKRQVHASYVTAPSAGPGSLVVFESDRFVFIGDAATGQRTLITDGSLPVWSR